MLKATSRFVCVLLAVLTLFTVGGVFATWKYATQAPTPAQSSTPISVKDFTYGMFYITTVKTTDGTYSSAYFSKNGDVDVNCDITLTNTASSSVTIAVSFYNNTNVNYYYDKTETVSSDNSKISYEVTGISQKDAVSPHSSKTLYVTFSYDGSVPSDKSLLAQLHFKFVLDKEAIGDIVAQTAVDRFRDILNNKAYSTSYSDLITGMDNRSGFNKASAITYIGNVAGSSSGDSKLIETLFGEQFMSMDLDGDGKAEPITMMIKRENLDNNVQTGADYTYSTWSGSQTVRGVEMTLYITSQDLDNVSSGQTVVVYAATFTKLPGATEWTDLVSLTKGTAKANNYSGYGSANSFNTDTWVSDGGDTIKELAQSN